MNATPELPHWIRHAEVGGYLAAHQLDPTETRLYGTEGLYGDWDATTLLLAKDFYPSSEFRSVAPPETLGPIITTRSGAPTRS